MAETAKILTAQASIAARFSKPVAAWPIPLRADQFREFVAAHPDHVVVTYVNSTAAVKAFQITA